MTPVRVLKNFSDLYAYSFWKVCHPVRLLKTVCTFIRDIRVSMLYNVGMILWVNTINGILRGYIRLMTRCGTSEIMKHISA